MEKSIIIHGPLHENTIKSVNKYKDYANLILVHPKPLDDRTKKIYNELSDLTLNNENMSIMIYGNVYDNKFDNYQNRYYHFLSSVIGFNTCKTEYCLKMRSDEYYDNIEPFFNAIFENTDKMVTSDTYFRKSTAYVFHPSDHLIGGKTKVLRKVFALAKKYTESSNMIPENPFLHYMLCKGLKIHTEQIIGSIYLHYKYPDMYPEDINDHKKIMKNSFFIVAVKDLGEFEITSNYISATFKDYSFYDTNSDVGNIEEYE